MRSFLFCAVSGLLAVACSSSSASPGTSTDPAATTPPASPPAPAAAPPAPPGGMSNGTSANGALKIVNLSATAPTVTGGNPSATEANSVTFVAIVTDAKGLDSIAGGELLDDMGTTYGSFGTGSTKGTYSSALTWTQINQGRAIEFGAAGGTRSFVAKFYDNDGNVATAALAIKLACRLDASALVGACAGACVDLTTGDACGTCGTPCARGQACGASGTCAAIAVTGGFSACTPAKAVATGTTCADVCTKAGAPACSGAYPNPTTTCNPDQDKPGTCSTSLATPSAPAFFQCGCGT
ncbi:MAG TPA: hypothetical protein VIF62_03385 [Labilithrix sp.]|jgi:hypothetical protein